MAELVLGLLLPSVKSLAVTVKEPLVPKVILKFVLMPPARAALPGKVALASLEVIPTVSVTVFTKFQVASTALTVALKGVPADCVDGVPLLPVGEPGTTVSPSAKICNFTNAPALTAIDALVLLVMAPWVTSDPVTVALAAVLSVTLR